MSLYNMLFGTNSIANVLLAMLDIDQADGLWSSGRFRDAFLNADGTQILLYTRNGGGNRNHYDDNLDEVDDDDRPEGCRCTGCCITTHLPKHPNYIRNEDDDFDCTYATVYFSVPEKYLEATKAIATGEEPSTASDRFLQLIDSMKASR